MLKKIDRAEEVTFTPISGGKNQKKPSASNAVPNEYCTIKIKLFEKFMYSISHYHWCRNFIKKRIHPSSEEFYMTRSDWIAYYLAKSGNNVIFEIHNYSRTRNYVLRKISKFENIKLIFLTEGLRNSFSDLPSKYEIIPSGVDESLFQEVDNKDLDVVFVGNLKRFGQSRNIDFLINAFSENNELQNIKLTVVGGPSEEVMRLKKLLDKGVANIDFVGCLLYTSPSPRAS